MGPCDLVPGRTLLTRIFLRNYAWSLAALRGRSVTAAYHRAIFRVAIFLGCMSASLLACTWALATHFGLNPLAGSPSSLWWLVGLAAAGIYWLLDRHFAPYVDKPEAANGYDTFRDLLYLYAEVGLIAVAIAASGVSLFCSSLL